MTTTKVVSHTPGLEQRFRDAIQGLPNARRSEAWEAWKELRAVNAETLEALRDLVRYITDDDWRCEQDQIATDASDGNVNAYEMLTERARAAIAKAEGT